MRTRTHESRIRALRVVLALGVAGALCAAVFGTTVPPAHARAGTVARALTQNQYLSLAQQGVNKAAAWGNRKFRWYNEILNDRTKYPQATIWALAPLFESEAYIATGHPTSANVARLKAFANHAEKYFDPNITPAPGISRRVRGYAPYPNSRSNQKVFFDDNAWWSLGFVDAYTAMLSAHNSALARRYLADAVRGFKFIYPNSWDTHDAGGPDSVRSTRGGMYWNTYHVIPGGLGRSGEALASATELAAELYKATGARIYLTAAIKYITWANQNLLKWDGSYATQIPHEVTMPHDGEGALIGAFAALCGSKAGTVPRSVYSFLPANKTHAHPSFRLPDKPSSWCSWAEVLARHTAFGVNPGGGVQDKFFPLTEGPQWDAIYLRGLLSLYAYDHDGTWYRLVSDTASQIVKQARLSNGEYLKSWTGSGNVPGSSQGMLRTHAASVSVLADLSSVAAP